MPCPYEAIVTNPVSYVIANTDYFGRLLDKLRQTQEADSHPKLNIVGSKFLPVVILLNITPVENLA